MSRISLIMVEDYQGPWEVGQDLHTYSTHKNRFFAKLIITWYVSYQFITHKLRVWNCQFKTSLGDLNQHSLLSELLNSPHLYHHINLLWWYSNPSLGWILVKTSHIRSVVVILFNFTPHLCISSQNRIVF